MGGARSFKLLIMIGLIIIGLSDDQSPFRSPPRVTSLEQKMLLSLRKLKGSGLLCQMLLSLEKLQEFYKLYVRNWSQRSNVSRNQKQKPIYILLVISCS